MKQIVFAALLTWGGQVCTGQAIHPLGSTCSLTDSCNGVVSHVPVFTGASSIGNSTVIDGSHWGVQGTWITNNGGLWFAGNENEGIIFQADSTNSTGYQQLLAPDNDSSLLILSKGKMKGVGLELFPSGVASYAAGYNIFTNSKLQGSGKPLDTMPRISNATILVDKSIIGYGGITASDSAGYVNIKGNTAYSYVKDSAWLKTGNSGTSESTNYIGTNDNVGLMVKTNGIQRGRFDTLGNFYASNSVDNVKLQYAHRIYFIGNSICAGFPFYWNNYPVYVTNDLGSSWTGTNLGVPGNETNNILSRITSITSQPNAEYAVVEGGINDVINNVKALTIEANLQSIVNDLVAVNIKVVVLNIGPTNSLTATQILKLDSVNTWEASGSFTSVSYKIDQHTLLQSSIDGDSIKNAYAYETGPHLSTLGAQTLGNYIYTHVTWTPKYFTQVPLGVSGTSARIDQPLDSIDIAWFGGVIAGGIPGDGAITFSSGLGVNNGTNMEIGSPANSLARVTTGSNLIAMGNYALSLNTTGSNNVALGYQALYANTIGSDNTAIGSSSLFNNTTGSNNTSVGLAALYNNTTATFNTAIGYQALEANTHGGQNVAIGYNAMCANTGGDSCVGIGVYSLGGNTTGTDNTAIGFQALKTNTTGVDNTAIGYDAAYKITGSNNTAGGWAALASASSANDNTAWGMESLNSNTSGSNNTSDGYLNLGDNSSGSNNTSVGAEGLDANTTGKNNTSVGYNALGSNVSASSNTALGCYAGNKNTAGQNVFLGDSAGYSNTSGSNVIAIGYQAVNTTSNTVQLGNSSITKVTTNGSYVVTGTGNGLMIPAGSNCRVGTATLSAGTVTISNTAVTANSIIFVSYNTPGGTTGSLSAPAGSISAGTQFVINSSSATDSSTVNWFIIN